MIDATNINVTCICLDSVEHLCVLTVNGHVIGGQIGVYVTAQWYIKKKKKKLCQLSGAVTDLHVCSVIQ